MNGSEEDTKRALRNAETALENSLTDQADLKEEVMSKVKQFAHDIKNPLTAMIGLSKLMKMGVTTPEKIQPNAEIIHQSATRILGLCEDMLMHTEAALSADKINIATVDDDKVQDVDAAEMIEEVTSLYAEMAQERDINLTADVSDDFPKINTIPRHLYRALTNIMSNAMKFTPGGGHVEINAGIDKQEDAMILVIRDSGDGIPAQQIPQILKPYKTTVSPHGDKGTGLGLPIVNQLMLELGGKKEISSREHEGTTVTLRFPSRMTR
jgi:two-component system, cell cycle sensor histidine kinase PleC